MIASLETKHKEQQEENPDSILSRPCVVLVGTHRDLGMGTGVEVADAKVGHLVAHSLHTG